MALPKFSRNYTSKGAYENPQTVIDDKTGLFYAQAINSIGQNVSKTLDTIAAKQSEAAKRQQLLLDQNREFVLNKTEAYMTNLQKAGVNNPSLYSNIHQVMDVVAQADLGARSSKSREEQQVYLNKQAIYQASLNKMGALIEAGKDADATWKQDNIDNLSSVGSQGGVATVGQGKYYPIFNEAMGIRNGMPGTEEWYLNEENQWRIKYMNDSIREKYGENGIDVMAATFLNFDPGKVPEINKMMDAVIGAPTKENPGGLSIKVNGQLGDDWYNRDTATFGYNKDNTMRYFIYEQDKEKILGAVTPAFKAQAKALLKNPQQANIVWMQIFGNEEELKSGKGLPGSVFSKESQEDFIKSYIQYGIDRIPMDRKGGMTTVPSSPKTGGNSITAQRDKEMSDQIDDAWLNTGKTGVNQFNAALSNFKNYKYREVDESGSPGLYQIVKEKNIEGEDTKTEIVGEFNINYPEDINKIKNLLIGLGRYKETDSTDKVVTLDKETVGDRISQSLLSDEKTNEDEFINSLDEKMLSLTRFKGERPVRASLSDHMEDLKITIDTSNWGVDAVTLINEDGVEEEIKLSNTNEAAKKMSEFITKYGNFGDTLSESKRPNLGDLTTNQSKNN